ncbi:hypothetical protein CHS0354_000469 [Potamilus streckersoni]|uniref:Aspartokinase n=1 Tax=Potamilus streckersoni TaxID=2493646 RepID=A0AAE0T6R6_9BIVA|nr:hypothetical protein CHS0354_000469 [Potamilus streckersoni]
MVVMKFGGTSVEDAQAMAVVSSIVKSEITKSNSAPMVIVSACAGVTNKLLTIISESENGNLREALTILEEIKKKHETIVVSLFQETPIALKLLKKIQHVEQDIKKLLKAIHAIGECPNSLKDVVVANGEILSSTILNEKMNLDGIKTTWIDAKLILITDDKFTRAKPLWDISESKVNLLVRPLLDKGYVVLSQGFIGATQKGKTTTLGRGGSDYSAAIFGSLLNASAIQIWTDVDGVLTSDPRVVPNARRLKQMTFNEAAELAYFGAKVLHPATIQPAVTKNIPVLVLNSKRPEIEGTVIMKEIQSFDGLVKAVACKKDQTIINLTTTNMLGTVGFFYSVAKIFNDQEIPIDMVSTSEISISLTVSCSYDSLNVLVKQLSTIADVKIKNKVASICVVGDNLQKSSGVASKIFQTVSENNINIIMISQGASETNVGFVVEEVDADTVVRSLHKTFFSQIKEKTVFA